ncbi:MAG: hypothetical protein WBX22_07495 [Silvibacterium sp.]
MAQYTVRVELHKANSDDYENLHEYMEHEGFIHLGQIVFQIKSIVTAPELQQ